MATWKSQRDAQASRTARDFSDGAAFDKRTLGLAAGHGHQPDPQVHQREMHSSHLEIRYDGATGRVVSATAW